MKVEVPTLIVPLRELPYAQPFQWAGNLYVRVRAPVADGTNVAPYPTDANGRIKVFCLNTNGVAAISGTAEVIPVNVKVVADED